MGLDTGHGSPVVQCFLSIRDSLLCTTSTLKYIVGRLLGRTALLSTVVFLLELNVLVTAVCFLRLE